MLMDWSAGLQPTSGLQQTAILTFAEGLVKFSVYARQQMR